jgi:hypothetical protein
MTMLSFTSVMKIYNCNPYIQVSAEQATSLKPGWRKPMPVLIRINGKPTNAWQINMMPMGNGDFCLYLHGDVRKASKTKVGDTVKVEVRFDNSYKNGPLHAMPLWFSTALKKNPEAKKTGNCLLPAERKKFCDIFLVEISGSYRSKPKTCSKPTFRQARAFHGQVLE